MKTLDKKTKRMAWKTYVNCLALNEVTPIEGEKFDDLESDICATFDITRDQLVEIIKTKGGERD